MLALRGMQGLWLRLVAVLVACSGPAVAHRAAVATRLTDTEAMVEKQMEAEAMQARAEAKLRFMETRTTAATVPVLTAAAALAPLPLVLMVSVL